VLIAVVLLALLAAGAASAAVMARTTFLAPGKCTKVNRKRVCAKKVPPKTVTVTVAPSPTGQTFSGNGSKTLAPITLSHGVNVGWTAKPDSYGYNLFSVSGGAGLNYVSFDNGNSSMSGTSYVPPGTYTFDVIASGAWTLKF
jgi:CDP-diglyceride synthetase